MTILNDFPTSFTPEIIWLSLSITWLAISMLLTEGVILSLVVFRARKLGGFWQGMLNTLPDESPLNDETITRAFQGHWNAFKDLALFVPLAITIHVADTGNPVTAFACASYFWVQFLYIPLYVFKFSILTATVWVVGLIATCTLAFQVLG